MLFAPPVWTRHLAALLTIPAFVLLAAAYVPGNALKRAIGHPMVAGVKVWALAHLLANGTLADLFLCSAPSWCGPCWVSSPRGGAIVLPARPIPQALGSRTAITVVVGLVAWAVFAFALHRPLIGVAPFG